MAPLRLALAALVLLPASAQARRESNEIECVTILTMWSGSTAETRLIETTPVPDSYRTIFAAGPCNTLHRPSLIDWHLAFGSAASVTAALAFLEADSTRGVPTGDPFLTGVGAAWHRAQPSIRTLARLDVPGGDVRWRRAVAADRTIRALQPFARGYEASVFLAEQYLRAAEFHRSPELLATARLYLRAATEGVRLFFDDALVAMAADPPAAHLLNLPAGTVNAVRDMEARASVLHATLTRAPTDLAEASRLLDRGDGALLRHAAIEAYEHGGDLCDVGDRADLEAIRTACKNVEGDFEGRLLAYWRVRATLELLDPQPAPPGDEAFDLAAKTVAPSAAGTSRWMVDPTRAVRGRARRPLYPASRTGGSDSGQAATIERLHLAGGGGAADLARDQPGPLSADRRPVSDPLADARRRAESGRPAGRQSFMGTRSRVPRPDPCRPPADRHGYDAMTLLPITEAQSRLFALAAPIASEEVTLAQAAGRWAAADVRALRTQPAVDLSAMDGYALRFTDLPGPWRVIGESAAGRPFAGAVGAGEATRIFTGAAMPAGTDTVLIQEEAGRDGEQLHLTGVEPPHLGRNTRRKGLDFGKGDRLIAAGERITPARLAVTATAGHGTIPVRRRVRVALAATGDELVDPGRPLSANALPESNRAMLAAMLADLPVDLVDLGILPDRLDTMRDAFAGVDADLLVTTGGASVGDHDLVRPALAAAGGRVDFWRVALRPGKPMMAGRLGRTTVLGLPGNPVSRVRHRHLVRAPADRAPVGSGRSPAPAASRRAR